MARRRDTPLITASLEGDLDTVNRLLKEGHQDIDARGILGYTALMWACSSGHRAVAKLLLDHGAKTDSRNNLDETALMLAAGRGQTEVVRLLLERGADHTLRTKGGSTALDRVRRNKKEDIVQILLEAEDRRASRDDHGRQQPEQHSAENEEVSPADDSGKADTIKNKALMIRKVLRRHTHDTPLQGVRPSDRIKLSVDKVTSEQYDRLHSDLREIRRVAFPLCLVVSTAQDTLASLRPQIERFTGDSPMELSPNWRFLDVAVSGRVDRMFQVTQDQEDNICVGNFLSDGLLVMEMDTSPTGTPQPVVRKTLSPMDAEERAENEEVSPADDSESKQLFMEAMKYGYVDALVNVLLLIGAAGSGKTHAKHLFLGLLPPLVRESTPLAEEAIRTISTLQAAVSDANEMLWELVTLPKLKQMLAGAIKAGPSFFKLLPPQMPPPSTSLSEPGAGSHDIPPRSDPSVQSHSDESSDSPSGASVDIPVEYQQDQEFLDLIKSSEGSQKLFEVDWVYIIDSGGQPSFREILPLFVRTATAIAFFLKLNERLGDRPTVEYYGSGGQRCGASYTSLLTNEQILLHCVRSMQSRQSLSSEASAPSVFVVGTHKDREGECEETRGEKNSKLLEMLRPCFDDKLAYYSVKRPEEVIFPVNAKTPTTEDQKVAKAFRNKVTRMGGRVKLPLPWFVLEQYVDKLALELNRKVLSIRECEQEAKKLEMNQQACEAALVFLDKLDRLFYRPNVLKGVVFCGSQVPLDKISELIKLLHMLLGCQLSGIHSDAGSASPGGVQVPRGRISKLSRLLNVLRGRHPPEPPQAGHLSSHVGQSPPEAEETHVQLPGSPTASGPDQSSAMFPDLSEFDDEQLLKLRDYGIITIEVLKKFPKHYDEGLFTPKGFLKLLTSFQVAAPLSEGSPEFVMPCLLQELAPQELHKHRQLDPSSPAAPLLIQFPDNWVPAGVFTVLIVYLQNVARWKLCLLSGNPRCFYRNCVEFRLPTGHGGSVTLVDSFQYIEVHVINATVRTCSKACSQIVWDILEGIKQAALRLQYGALEPDIAFFCQTPTPACNSVPHLAYLAEVEWVCSVNPDIHGHLSSRHQVWFSPEPGCVHLTVRDFKAVTNALWPIRSKWRQLGVQLDLSLGDLDAIKKDHRDQSDECFGAMLQKWLQSTAKPTWQKLCAALREPTVDNEGLSMDIAKLHCT